MNYLVTGAAGFIGSAVAKKLINDGHAVTTIDNLSTGKMENLPAEINFVKGDVYDESILSKLANTRFDAIIHIAGQSSGEISFEDPKYDLQTNTLSTLLLLKMAQVGGGKKVYIYFVHVCVWRCGSGTGFRSYGANA